jgi:hypothetical protein
MYNFPTPPSPTIDLFNPELNRKADSHTTVGTADTIGLQTNEVTDTLQNAEIIEQGVSTFLEVVSTLISGLDQVASIHPFIKGTSPFYHAVLIVKHPM